MEVAEVGAPGGTKVTRSLLRKAKQVFILLHVICLLCLLVVTNGSSMKFKRVNHRRLRVLNMLCARAVGRHAKGGELHLCL